MPVRTAAFEAAASTVPPPRQRACRRPLDHLGDPIFYHRAAVSYIRPAPGRARVPVSYRVYAIELRGINFHAVCQRNSSDTT